MGGSSYGFVEFQGRQVGRLPEESSAVCVGTRYFEVWTCSLCWEFRDYSALAQRQQETVAVGKTLLGTSVARVCLTNDSVRCSHELCCRFLVRVISAHWGFRASEAAVEHSKGRPTPFGKTLLHSILGCYVT